MTSRIIIKTFFPHLKLKCFNTWPWKMCSSDVINVCCWTDVHSNLFLKQMNKRRVTSSENILFWLSFFIKLRTKLIRFLENDLMKKTHCRKKQKLKKSHLAQKKNVFVSFLFSTFALLYSKNVKLYFKRTQNQPTQIFAFWVCTLSHTFPNFKNYF